MATNNNVKNGTNNIKEILQSLAIKFIFSFILTFIFIIIYIAILIVSDVEDNWQPARELLWSLVGILLLEGMLIGIIIAYLKNKMFPPRWSIWMEYFFIILSSFSFICPFIIAIKGFSQAYTLNLSSLLLLLFYLLVFKQG